MNTTDVSQKSVNTRTLLLPYAGALVLAMVIIQAVIAFTGGEITLLAGVLTAAVAVGIAVWMGLNYRALIQVRFGLVVAHAIAFAAVTTSFNTHATIRSLVLAGGPDGFQRVAHDLLETPWFGATLMMSSVWGIGLLIHLFGAVLGRGWED